MGQPPLCSPGLFPIFKMNRCRGGNLNREQCPWGGPEDRGSRRSPGRPRRRLGVRRGFHVTRLLWHRGNNQAPPLRPDFLTAPKPPAGAPDAHGGTRARDAL